MTIDERGRLWVALYEGGAVVCCDTESGAILERIDVPASRTTSCAFGGSDLADLFITSGRNPAEPESGGIFVVRPGVRGVPAFSFSG
jgi:sugar lactone lactonase YvrE